MAVVGNLNFFYFLRLTRKILSLKSECGGSVCLQNNKIIDLNKLGLVVLAFFIVVVLSSRIRLVRGFGGLIRPGVIDKNDEIEELDPSPPR